MNDAVMQAMQNIWQRIENQLRIEAERAKMPASEALHDFQPGATEEEIQAAEAALGIAFPEDVKASYRIHNGQMDLGDPKNQNLRQLCSLQEVVDNWEMMKCYDDGEKVQVPDDWLDWDGRPILVRVEVWNLKWIPLLHSNGILVCLDLTPTPHGSMGQIIESNPENGTNLRWLAPSWQSFLSTFADDLEAGEYCFEEGFLTWS